MPEPTCAQCGAPNPPPNNGRPRKFCSRSCNNAAHRDSATKVCSLAGCDAPMRAKSLCGRHYLAAREHLRDRRSEYFDRTCETCDTNFRSSRKTGRFCSDACKAAAYRVARRKPRPLVHVTEGARCLLGNDHPVMRYAATQVFRGHWWSLLIAGPCAWCEESFTQGTTSGEARYCSPRCAKSAARAKHGRFLVPPKVRLAIYERDGWTCQLCLESVDRDLMTTDPFGDWAPSLDHIECQSWALIPDHSPANLRLAHRWCNAVRGDGRYYTESDLRATAA